MSIATERRLLQMAVAIVCLVPLSVSTTSIALGARWMQHAAATTDLDSHFRYLSGIFLALGIAFAACVPAIERQGPRFRLLGAMVVAGGLARALSLVQVGTPSTGHLVGLCIELGVVPALLLWQTSLARRWIGTHL